MIKNRIDYHNHNGFYRGSNQIWSISQGWLVAQKKGISHFGVSPKLESSKQDFILFLREELNKIKNEKPNENIFFGIELDIKNTNGKTQLIKENNAKLDYVIMGPHQMPHRSLVWEDLDEEDIDEYFGSLRDILFNSMKNNRVDIWAHPFLQEIQISAGKFMGKMEPIMREILELCENKGIAIEINENYFRKNKPPEESKKLWNSSEKYYSEKIKTLKKLFGIALNDYNVKFTFASDTHNLENIGDINECIKFAENMGIKDNKILLL